MMSQNNIVQSVEIESELHQSNCIVETNDLSRRFGKKNALSNISIQIPRGCVCGIIGENGAGKTTLIKHLLGALRAQSGSVRVFGLDPTIDPVGVLSRVGYLSEERDLPTWMTLKELMNYTSAFYSQWDTRYANDLSELFELSATARIQSLSRGQRARAGLLLALAHRPELLILDEPSSGLDPIVRQDILSAIIRTVSDEGRTVIFSSHLLEEVERVADRIAFLHLGRLLAYESLDKLKSTFKRVTLRFQHDLPKGPVFLDAKPVDGGGFEWTYDIHSRAADYSQLHRFADEARAQVVEISDLNLDEIFISRIRTESSIAN